MFVNVQERKSFSRGDSNTYYHINNSGVVTYQDTITYSPPNPNSYVAVEIERPRSYKGTLGAYYQQMLTNGYVPTREFLHTSTRKNSGEIGLRVYSSAVYFWLDERVKARLNDLGYISQGRSWSLISNTLVDEAPLLSAAEIIALNKLKDHSFNAAVTLAELGPTLNMVTNTVRRLSRSYSLLRRGNVRSALHALGGSDDNAIKRMRESLTGPAKDLYYSYESGRPPRGKARAAFMRERKKRSGAWHDGASASTRPLTSREAANAWLEMKYGWVPLLADVKAAADAIASRYVTKPPVTRVKGQAVGSSQASGTINDTLVVGATGAGWYANVSGVLNQTKVCRRGFVARRVPGAASLATELGFTNPLLVAWELVPLSFVADWFIPVGKYLEAMSATRGWEILDHWESILTTNELECTVTASARYSWQSAITENPVHTANHRMYWRKPLPLVPSFNLRPDPSLNISKLITSIALLRQRMSS